MAEPLAYLHGRLLPASETALPLHDAGFVFSATVTDLCRTFRHRLFRLDDHLARFRQSCADAAIPQPIADDELAHVAERLVAHNAALLQLDADLALVLFATPGPIGFYGGLPDDGPPTLGMHTFPLPFGRYARFLREGVRLVVPAVRHVPADCVAPHIKQRSRLHWWLAEQEVRRADPGAMALLLDHAGHVTETASSNLALVRGGAVRTPPRTSVLDGISLRVVEELCAELGLPFEERPLTVADCLGADEVFLTCTTFCLAGVRSLNGQLLPWPGPTFLRLAEAWSRRVGLDMQGQILAAAR